MALAASVYDYPVNYKASEVPESLITYGQAVIATVVFAGLPVTDRW